MDLIHIGRQDVLVIVDAQNDFCPGGALPTPGGDEIMPGIVELAGRFHHVIATQDYHPARHSSFASQHEGRKSFEVVTMPYGSQILWPDHCVQDSFGVEFHTDVAPAIARAGLVLRKGMDPSVDGYSGFLENDKTTRTGLGSYLHERDLRRCFFVGLAYDFCVGNSAVDCVAEAGLDAFIIHDLTRGVGLPLPPDATRTHAATSIEDIETRLDQNDVKVISSTDLAGAAVPFTS